MDELVVLHEGRCMILVPNVVSDPYFRVLELQFGVLAELFQVHLDFVTLFLNVVDQFCASLSDVVFALVVFDGNKLFRFGEVDQLVFLRVVFIFVVHQGLKAILICTVDLSFNASLSLVRQFDVVVEVKIKLLRIAHRIRQRIVDLEVIFFDFVQRAAF